MFSSPIFLHKYTLEPSGEGEASKDTNGQATPRSIVLESLGRVLAVIVSLVLLEWFHHARRLRSNNLCCTPFLIPPTALSKWGYSAFFMILAYKGLDYTHCPKKKTVL